MRTFNLLEREDEWERTRGRDGEMGEYQLSRFMDVYCWFCLWVKDCVEDTSTWRMASNCDLCKWCHSLTHSKPTFDRRSASDYMALSCTEHNSHGLVKCYRMQGDTTTWTPNKNTIPFFSVVSGILNTHKEKLLPSPFAHIHSLRTQNLPPFQSVIGGHV